MRELTLQELSNVSGGLNMSDVGAAMKVVATVATHPVTRYVAINSGVGMAGYGTAGLVNGNGTTWQGFAGAAVGGVVGGASKNALFAGYSGQAIGGAVEGFLNGKGQLAQIYAQRQQTIDEASGF